MDVEKDFESDCNVPPSESYKKGYIEAVSEFLEHSFCLDEALHLFCIDPPEGDFQEGYRDALLSIRKYGFPVHHVGNVVYVGWQTLNEKGAVNDL